MKSIRYKIAAFAVSVMLISSCEEVLVVKPVVELADELALSSTAGLDAALIGAYNKLQNGDLYGGRYWVSPDMIAGTVKISGLQNTVFEELQLLNKTMSGQSNRIVHATWQVSYEAIAIINQLLAYLPDVNDAEMTDEIRKRLEGEAKFLRGLIFFEMTRLFSFDVSGEGPLSVPVFTEPLSPFDTPFRSTVDGAYEQIIMDLEDAATLLAGINTNNRASSVGAKALLSRVYFYQEDWPGVISAANYVIDQFSGKPHGGLANDMLDCFQTGNPDPEVLFAILASAVDDASGTLRSYYRVASNSKFTIPIPYLVKIGAHVGTHDDARARVDHAFVNIDGKVYTTKFDVEFLNVPVIRLAEVYLNRAEARVHEGDPDGATADLNVVRERSDAGSYTGSATLEDCETERNIELYLEGDYFHNMKRLKKPNFAVDIAGNAYNWDDVKLVFPIPASQLNVNPNLKQNR
ncbi:MAG: RagB/SusD family nutrient uptake outer membrane protein [Bacteroidales bacterium]|nr:RagB/SusD family nutrient uptake outer membrane protein [Bacteroidales bacterium]